MPDTVLFPDPWCSKCGGTGFVTHPGADGVAQKTRCPCVKEVERLRDWKGPRLTFVPCPVCGRKNTIPAREYAALGQPPTVPCRDKALCAARVPKSTKKVKRA